MTKGMTAMVFTICHGQTNLSQDGYGMLYNTKQRRWIWMAADGLISILSPENANGKLKHPQISELNLIHPEVYLDVWYKDINLL